MAVPSFQRPFLASTYGRFYLVFLSVQKEKTSLSEQSSYVLWKIAGVPASTFCHAAILALLMEEAVVETEPAVLLLSALMDYYSHSIIYTMIEHGVELFQT